MKNIFKNKFFIKIKDFFKTIKVLLKFLTARQKFIAYLCIFLLITFVFHIFFGESGIIKYISVKTQNVRYEKLLTEQKDINAKFKNDLSLLRANSSDITDEILKQKFNMGTKGTYILKQD